MKQRSIPAHSSSHLMNSDIAWVLVSLRTQVQSQYSIQTTFHTIFPFLMAIISQTKEPRLLKRFFIDVIDVARFTVSINFETKPGMKLFKNQVRCKVYPVIFSFLFLDARR